MEREKLILKVELVVSPVDAVVLYTGHTKVTSIHEDILSVYVEQVKGVTYSVKEFLGEEPEGLKRKSNGNERYLQYIVMYLAPGDYHHFHSPSGCEITQRRHFPGALIPVRPWAVERIPGLYCYNERVVLNGKWINGFFSFVAVGGLNVGSIEIRSDEQLQTNQDSTLPYQQPKII